MSTITPLNAIQIPSVPKNKIKYKEEYRNKILSCLQCILIIQEKDKSNDTRRDCYFKLKKISKTLSQFKAKYGHEIDLFFEGVQSDIKEHQKELENSFKTNSVYYVHTPRGVHFKRTKSKITVKPDFKIYRKSLEDTLKNLNNFNPREKLQALNYLILMYNKDIESIDNESMHIKDKEYYDLLLNKRDMLVEKIEGIKVYISSEISLKEKAQGIETLSSIVNEKDIKSYKKFFDPYGTTLALKFLNTKETSSKKIIDGLSHTFRDRIYNVIIEKKGNTSDSKFNKETRFSNPLELKQIWIEEFNKAKIDILNSDKLIKKKKKKPNSINNISKKVLDISELYNFNTVYLDYFDRCVYDCFLNFFDPQGIHRFYHIIAGIKKNKHNKYNKSSIQCGEAVASVKESGKNHKDLLHRFEKTLHDPRLAKFLSKFNFKKFFKLMKKRELKKREISSFATVLKSISSMIFLKFQIDEYKKNGTPIFEKLHFNLQDNYEDIIIFLLSPVEGETNNNIKNLYLNSLNKIALKLTKIGEFQIAFKLYMKLNQNIKSSESDKLDRLFCPWHNFANLRNTIRELKKHHILHLPFMAKTNSDLLYYNERIKGIDDDQKHKLDLVGRVEDIHRTLSEIYYTLKIRYSGCTKALKKNSELDFLFL